MFGNNLFGLAMLVALGASACKTLPLELRSGERSLKGEHSAFRIEAAKKSDPNTEYGYIFIVGHSFAIEDSDLDLMCEKFGVKKVRGLIGRQILSTSADSPHHALTNLVYYLRTGIDWVPTTKQGVYKAAAMALARKQCPLYPHADHTLVKEAFADVFDEHMSGEQAWISWLADEVNRFSEGRVRIGRKKKGMPSPFGLRYNEFGADLSIHVNGRHAPFLLRPSATPFACAWGKHENSK